MNMHFYKLPQPKLYLKIISETGYEEAADAEVDQKFIWLTLLADWEEILGSDSQIERCTRT